MMRRLGARLTPCFALVWALSGTACCRDEATGRYHLCDGSPECRETKSGEQPYNPYLNRDPRSAEAANRCGEDDEGDDGVTI